MRRFWKTAALVVLSLTAIAVVGAGVFFARLMSGPVSLDFMRDRIQSGINSNLGGLRVRLEGVLIERDAKTGMPHFRLRNVELTASVTRVRDERGHGRELYAGFAILFGKSTASVAHVQDDRGNRMTVDAQRSLPVGEGYGYQMHAESGDGMAYGVARYQTSYGRYELRQEQLNGDSNTTVSAAGSIVGIGGGVYASRPVQQSFAPVSCS